MKFLLSIAEVLDRIFQKNGCNFHHYKSAVIKTKERVRKDSVQYILSNAIDGELLVSFTYR